MQFTVFSILTFLIPFHHLFLFQGTQWVFVSSEHKKTAFQHNLKHHLPEQLHFYLLQPLPLPSSRSTMDTESQKSRGKWKGIEDNLEARTDIHVNGMQKTQEDKKGVKVHSRAKRNAKPLTPKEIRANVENVRLKDMERERKLVQTLPQREARTEECNDVVSNVKKMTKIMVSIDKGPKFENVSYKSTGTAARLSQAFLQQESTIEEDTQVHSRAKRQEKSSVPTGRRFKPKAPSLKQNARAFKLVKAVLQKSIAPAKSSSGNHIELLVAEYADDGSASFRKKGQWNSASHWVFDGPLQAAPATHFGGRTLTLTTLHVSTGSVIDGMVGLLVY